MSNSIALSGAHSLPSFPRQDVNKLPQGSTPARRIHEVDQRKVDPTLIKAAQGMESMFLSYMMKVMRNSIPENKNNLENGATKIYRSMLDNLNSDKAAKAGGIGLADLIIDYMLASSYNKRVHPGPIARAQPLKGVKPRDGASTEKERISE